MGQQKEKHRKINY